MWSLFLTVLLATSLQAHERGPEEGDEFEGDMILTSAQKEMLLSGGKTKKAAIIGYRWPNKIVPYVISSNLPSSAVTVIKSAIKEWEDNTCLDFKTRTTETGYIYFTKEGGCSSYVGYQGQMQKIRLGVSGCWTHGIVLHEIGHALGFFHEQSRTDRDNYVQVHWNNIIPGLEFNFLKYDNTMVNSLGKPYDYGSIMHYRSTGFSSNGLETITPLTMGVTIGQRIQLSTGDIAQMKLMYNCQ